MDVIVPVIFVIAHVVVRLLRPRAGDDLLLAAEVIDVVARLLGG